jgi:hypothetical protein
VKVDYFSSINQPLLHNSKQALATVGQISFEYYFYSNSDLSLIL